MYYVATSNPAKIQQFKEHFPENAELSPIVMEVPEEKWAIPEMVSYRKAKYLENKGYKKVIVDDRALYIEDLDIPGTNINSYLELNEKFGAIFGEKNGTFVYSFAYSCGKYIHVYSNEIDVKISKEKGKESHWGKLGQYIIPPGYKMPLSNLDEKENNDLEKKLKQNIFWPFFSSLQNHTKVPSYSNEVQNKRKINFFKRMRHIPMEKLELKIKELVKEPEVNMMTLKKRVLLSLAYYSPETFFNNVKFSYDSLPYSISCYGEVSNKAEDLISKIIEYHTEKIKKNEIKNKRFSSYEKDEKNRSNGNLIHANGKIYVERENEKEELEFKEINESFVTDVYDKLHYLSSARKNVKSYALYNADDVPVSMISVGEIEREYKKELLFKDGIKKGYDLTRAYNSMWKVKGVLSFLLAKVKKTFGEEFYLTAYQPSFSEGTGIYGAGFTPYIIKPQQNYYTFDKYKGQEIPIFTIRRNITEGLKIEKGKFPLLPTIEMISPNVNWLHFTDKLYD